MNYKSNEVWLGGQDIVEEGHWMWTSAGNQPLAEDLEWGPGICFNNKGIRGGHRFLGTG